GVGIGKYFRFTQESQHFEDGSFRATADDVSARNQLCIPCPVHCTDRRWFIRAVTVQKGMPYCFASPGSALASTVVREKEAYTSLQNQMQVAMEILCVPRMANDSVPVRGLFIETERHPVHVRQIGAKWRECINRAVRLKGRKRPAANMLVSDYLRVAANKAEVVAPLRTLGFHTFRRTLASVLVKMEVDPKL